MQKETNNQTNENKINALKTITSEVLTLAFVCLVGIILGCPLKRLFGIPCPGCGLTRAGICIIIGDFNRSLYYHPLFLLLIPIAIAFILRNWIPKRILNIGAILFCIIYIGTYLYRMFILKSEMVRIHLDEGLIYQAFLLVRNFISRDY
ncbi:MAG: DUF2752 domain-containing protein [Lachnospiraceae bacterium]|nr:DUF2752 domain-containing protein [Candidatus Colinaster scatohippi]